MRKKGTIVSQEEKRKRTNYPGIHVNDLLLLPNLLTLLRLVWAIPALVLIVVGQGAYDLWAAGLLCLAFLTDVLDGFVARTFNLISDLGKVLDPVVDKLVVLSVAFALVLPFRDPALPIWLLLTIVFRDSIILIFAIRVLQEDHYLFTSSWTGKFATFAIATTLLAYLLIDYIPVNLLISLPLITEGLLILSGVDYLEKYWSVRHKRYQKRNENFRDL